MQMVAESGTSSSKSLTQRNRAATKRGINAIMERHCRTTLSTVTVGTRKGVEVLTEPAQVARECCDYGTCRFGSMEPKWFCPHDVAVSHEVYALTGATVGRGTVTSIDHDGHYVVRLNEHTDVTCVRNDICHVMAAAEVPNSQAVRGAAALRHADKRGTVQLFSRSEAG